MIGNTRGRVERGREGKREDSYFPEIKGKYRRAAREKGIAFEHSRTSADSPTDVGAEGVGIVLITVSGIAWRLTSHEAPSCRAMLGLRGDEPGGRRFVPRVPPYGGRPGGHPYAGERALAEDA
ncbi:hypothetical protein HPB49_022032 [Dermacentor silvarum]|uniref:Uncharacterized protein n=1 Tax=Dermacentor silvarum TaxID=543639 RepID=A0ACB8CT86_DERSI|nr:hypothetical protein HPB49_022032 [Dermacentor silvarum]